MSAEYQWDLTMMYLIHRALRRDVKAFAGTLRADSDPLTDPATREAFGARWAFFNRTLHHHHSGEDEVLWPYMRTARPDTRPLMDALEAEHGLLGPALVAVDGGVAGLAGSTVEQRHALADRVDELGQVLGDHLDHEEREGVPLLTATVDPTTAKDFERQQQKSMSLSDAAVFFPWITAEATQAEADVAWGNLPPPMRWLMRSRWTRSYERATAAAFPGNS